MEWTVQMVFMCIMYVTMNTRTVFPSDTYTLVGMLQELMLWYPVNAKLLNGTGFATVPQVVGTGDEILPDVMGEAYTPTSVLVCR